MCTKECRVAGVSQRSSQACELSAGGCLYIISIKAFRIAEGKVHTWIWDPTAFISFLTASVRMQNWKGSSIAYTMDMGSHSLHLLLDSICQDAVGKAHL
jgi:hypothetical protein